MTSRLSLRSELLRIVLALLAGFVGVTVIAVSIDLAGVSDAARTGRKLLVPLVILAYGLSLRLRLVEVPAASAVVPLRGAGRSVLIGLAAGTASLLLLNLVLVVLGTRVVAPELPPGRLALRVILSLLQALGLGLLEETLFRGLLHGRLARAGGRATALGLGAVLFAVSHFLRPPKSLEDGPAWRVAIDCLAGLGEIPFDRWKECAGLALVGAVLIVARMLSGSIWLPLGVHAGWVWVRQVADKTLEEIDAVVRTNEFFYGTMRHYDGLLGWAALGFTLLLLAGGPRWRSRECSSPSLPDSRSSKRSP